MSRYAGVWVNVSNKHHPHWHYLDTPHNTTVMSNHKCWHPTVVTTTGEQWHVNDTQDVEQACRDEVKDLKSLAEEDIVFNSTVVVRSWYDATYLVVYLATSATN